MSQARKRVRVPSRRQGVLLVLFALFIYVLTVITFWNPSRQRGFSIAIAAVTVGWCIGYLWRQE